MLRSAVELGVIDVHVTVQLVGVINPEDIDFADQKFSIAPVLHVVQETKRALP